MTVAELKQHERPSRGYATAIAAMVLSAACWGFATVMTKGALSGLPPFTLLTIQLGTSIAFLWGAVAAFRQRVPLGRGAGGAALSGLFEPGLAYGATVPGLALTSAANASVIGTAEPALVCAMAWLLLGDRPQAGVAFGVVGAMGGVALITLSGQSTGEADGHASGDLLVLAGTLFASLYVVMSSRSVAQFAPLPLAALQQTMGFLFSLLLLLGVWLLGLERLPHAVPAGAILLAAASGIVQYAMAFWFYLVGLRVLRTSVAALFLTLIPVFGVSGATVFLGETMTSAQWLGCAIVIAAVAVIAWRRG